MNQKSAFTLVELIVWVTISMLLMVSIGIILSSGIQNILKQEKIISNSQNFWESFQRFYNHFENLEDNYIFSSNSWVLFQATDDFQKIGLAYLWITNQTDNYCPIDSEMPNTKHLSWNFFLPYEEIWEDFLDNYSDILDVKSWAFRVDTINHQIYENDTQIIWWETFGYEFEQWANWTDIRLNNPTGIIQAEWWFFFSDTWNHRVLFYKNSKIYLILDRFDGLKLPTWLAYQSGALYISNTWKWEILKYSSEIWETNPTLNINFSPDSNYGSINRFELSFTGSEFIPNNTLKEDFTFDENHFIQNEDYLQIENDTLKYYFSDFLNSSQLTSNTSIPGCSPSNQYSVNTNSQVEKTQTTCSSTNTWSTYRYTGNNFQNLNSWNDYSIQLDNLTPQITESWVYLAQLDFYNNNTFIYSKIFPYFTQWTEKISDYQNNTLEVFLQNLEYPTGLEISGNILSVNDTLSRQRIEYNLDSRLQTNITNLFDFSAENLEKITFNPVVDEIIENPISEISINYDIVNNYLWMKIDYLHYLNCYNPDEFIKKEIIFWKNLEN